MIEILAASGYKPDFRNLFSKFLKGIDADKNYDGRNIILTLGNQKDECVIQINFIQQDNRWVDRIHSNAWYETVNNKNLIRYNDILLMETGSGAQDFRDK